MLGNIHDNSEKINIEDCSKPLLAELLSAYHTHGKDAVIAGDLTTPSMNFGELMLRSAVLSRKLKTLVDADPYVGLLLPNALATIVTFFSLHSLKFVPCMLNFTAGQASMMHACNIGKVRTIITSRMFVDKANLQPLVKHLQKHFKVIFLEDLRKTITLKDKIMGALAAKFPDRALQSAISSTDPEGVAVVLYTSGSEGAPKGVALSHKNILCNIAQSRMHLNLNSDHTVFNALPMFHSFGLTVGMLMPIFTGMKTVLYPSPVHFKQIPEEVEKCGASVMLGTDTFYQGYARYATKEQFASVKLAVAGAEKLQEKTRLHWLNELNVEILQGYGVTEASPVLSVNKPKKHKPGSVGLLVPGVEYRLEPVDGLDDGKKLLVRGPNIMMGYLKTDNPGVVQPQGDWYDTGDIVEVDDEGFITILGRAKRFAKIAGEMISLAVVEELAGELAAEEGHAAIAIPDERRGEQIILYTESAVITKQKLLDAAKQKGVPELCLPKEIQRIDVIPRLGSGKIDYMSLKNSMARS